MRTTSEVHAVPSFAHTGCLQIITAVSSLWDCEHQFPVELCRPRTAQIKQASLRVGTFDSVVHPEFASQFRRDPYSLFHVLSDRNKATLQFWHQFVTSYHSGNILSTQTKAPPPVAHRLGQDERKGQKQSQNEHL